MSMKKISLDEIKARLAVLGYKEDDIKRLRNVLG